MSLWKWFSERSSDTDSIALIVEPNSPALMARSQVIEAIGIETMGGVFTPIINVGQPIPFSITKMFSTAIHWQTEITLGLYPQWSLMCRTLIRWELLRSLVSLGNREACPKLMCDFSTATLIFSLKLKIATETKTFEWCGLIESDSI